MYPGAHHHMDRLPHGPCRGAAEIPGAVSIQRVHGCMSALKARYAWCGRQQAAAFLPILIVSVVALSTVGVTACVVPSNLFKYRSHVLILACRAAGAAVESPTVDCRARFSARRGTVARLSSVRIA